MRLDTDFLRDPALIAVLDALEVGGHRALPVGGCVRNGLLGQPVADVDIATDAHPDQVVACARAAGLKPVPTGIDHGTVTIIAHGTPFEVTTFRRDITTDGRHATVAFSDRIEDDAARRDFTMNALYCDRAGQVIDPMGGLPDLRARHLRFVGKPHDRITEDYLRILRFFRFFAWYGRAVDADALAACADLRAGLARISAERIGHEMRRLLAAPDPGAALALMDQTGVLAGVLPGADVAALARALAREGGDAPHWPRRLAALRAPDTADRLRLSRAEARAQSDLARALAQGWSLDQAAYHLGADAARDLALIGRDPPPPDWQAAIARAAASPLPIAARDLPELSGPAMGRALKAAETAWIASDFSARPADLIAAARAAEKDAS